MPELLFYRITELLIMPGNSMSGNIVAGVGLQLTLADFPSYFSPFLNSRQCG